MFFEGRGSREGRENLRGRKEGRKEGKILATKEGQGSKGQHWNLGQAARQKEQQ